MRYSISNVHAEKIIMTNALDFKLSYNFYFLHAFGIGVSILNIKSMLSVIKAGNIDSGLYSNLASHPGRYRRQGHHALRA